MKKVIVHALSSLLLRPNGIVRYINAVIDLQVAQGHTVYFVTDAKPKQKINCEVSYYEEESAYIPNMKDGHVWLQLDNLVSNKIRMAYTKLKWKPNQVIVHDLHSYFGLKDKDSNGIFVQHESDIVNANCRYSYMDDNYVSTHINIVNSTNWYIGMTVQSSTNISPQRSVQTPFPIILDSAEPFPRSKGLLFIGDASERKGAEDFMHAAKVLDIIPTVITHKDDINASIFDGADVYSFALHERDAMFALMKQHKVAYLPAKNECFSLAVLECLQYMPVIVNQHYEWTKHTEIVGATRAASLFVPALIKDFLNANYYNRQKLEYFEKHARTCWSSINHDNFDINPI